MFEFVGKCFLIEGYIDLCGGLCINVLLFVVCVRVVVDYFVILGVDGKWLEVWGYGVSVLLFGYVKSDLVNCWVEVELIF